MAVGWNRQDYMRMVPIRRIGHERRRSGDLPPELQASLATLTLSYQ
jgi:hypothetical protein